MKRNLLFLVALLIGANAFSQICVPSDYDWGNATYGVSPDPTQGESFEVGEVGVVYFDVIYVKCPATAGDVLGPEHPMYNMVATVPLDSVRLNSITLFNGLSDIPLSDIGLELTCNNNGESVNPCMFYPSHNYCGDIAGTPTTAGEWPVKINITAYFNAFGPQAIDYPLEGYTFQVDGEVSVNEATKANIFAVEQNSPNPANVSTTISYTLAGAEDVNIVITNLIGERVKSKMMKGKKGENNTTIDTSEIPNGIYLYSVQTGSKKITKRMVIQH